MLVITALYHLGSYFANEVLWLNIADVDILRDIVSRKYKFEAAFFILQFFVTLYTLACCCTSFFISSTSEIHKKVCSSLDKIHPMELFCQIVLTRHR